MDLMNYFLWILLIFMLITVIRIVKGPTIWDRVLGFSIISSKIVLMIVIFASINETAFLLDLAIIYALFGFLGEIFLIIFLSDRVKGGKEENVS